MTSFGDRKEEMTWAFRRFEKSFKYTEYVFKSFTWLVLIAGLWIAYEKTHSPILKYMTIFIFSLMSFPIIDLAMCVVAFLLPRKNKSWKENRIWALFVVLAALVFGGLAWLGTLGLIEAASEYLRAPKS